MSLRAELLMIFAKAPVPGRVKTRLAPAFAGAFARAGAPADAGFEAVARLHAAFVADVVERHTRVAAQRADREVVLYAAPEVGAGAADAFLCGLGVPVVPQSGSELGERMCAAFAEALGRFERVVILGTDSPSLAPARVDAAFEALGRAPVVIGPADDGGYYLLGLRGAVPPIFDGPRWGGDRVFADTVCRLQGAGCRYEVLEPAFDVDRPEDLVHLEAALAELARTGGAVPWRTAAALAALRASGGADAP